MKRIAIFVISAYAAIFLLLTWPVVMAGFYPLLRPRDGLAVFAWWPYWILIGILLLCQAGLLLIPLKITSKRPTSRKHICLPVIVSGFLIGALALGVICSLSEFIMGEKTFSSEWAGWSAITCWIIIWAIWSFVFSRIARGDDPQNIILRQCRWLLKGSIIALLVAVPTHIVARYRDYCCAGIYTFIGITFGIAVMLLSFGPGIFFLYAERWKKLHPKNHPVKTESDL
jgi:hypothetical protein